MKILEKNKVTTELEKTIFIDDAQLINWLKDVPTLAGFDLDNAEIIINIPGGGDWSNMELGIDEDCPIVVRVKKIDVKES